MNPDDQQINQHGAQKDEGRKRELSMSSARLKPSSGLHSVMPSRSNSCHSVNRLSAKYTAMNAAPVPQNLGPTEPDRPKERSDRNGASRELIRAISIPDPQKMIWRIAANLNWA